MTTAFPLKFGEKQAGQTGLSPQIFIPGFLPLFNNKNVLKLNYELRRSSKSICVRSRVMNVNIQMSTTTAMFVFCSRIVVRDL